MSPTAQRDPDARRTVLLHGFTGSAAAWGTYLLEALEARGLGPRAIDLPGHGARTSDTDSGDFTLQRVLLDVGAALGPSRGRGTSAEPVSAAAQNLIGYSMGGRLALHYAVRYPGRVRRLVLESASPGLATESERAARRAADEQLARGLEEEGIERFVQSWEASPLFASQRDLTQARRTELRARRLRNDAGALAASLRNLGTGTLPSLWEELAELDVEVLVLAGARDDKFVEIGERMVARLPRARLRVVEGAGHTVHLEAPTEWLEEVADFLGP